MAYTLTDLATRSAASECEFLGLFKIKASIPFYISLPSKEVGTKTGGHSLAIFYKLMSAAAVYINKPTILLGIVKIF